MKKTQTIILIIGYCTILVITFYLIHFIFGITAQILEKSRNWSGLAPLSPHNLLLSPDSISIQSQNLCKDAVAVYRSDNTNQQLATPTPVMPIKVQCSSWMHFLNFQWRIFWTQCDDPISLFDANRYNSKHHVTSWSCKAQSLLHEITLLDSIHI